MQLSENFSLAEMTRSATAKRYGIDNTPNEEQIENLKALCKNVLQPLRDEFGPITIGSGFRSKAVNNHPLVGGASKSQHMKGEAADIHLPSIEIGKKWFAWLQTHVVYDQLIWERDSPKSNHYWIHVSFSRTKNRMNVIPLLNKHKS